MSEKFPITCPKCQHAWQTSLAQLERDQDLYKGSAPANKAKTSPYRAQCPVCGVYFIVEIQAG